MAACRHVQGQRVCCHAVEMSGLRLRDVDNNAEVTYVQAGLGLQYGLPDVKCLLSTRYLISDQCAMPYIRYPRFSPRVEHGARQAGVGRQVVRAKSGAQRMRRSILGADACKRVGMQRVHVQVYACWQIGKQEKSSGLLKQCPLPLFAG